MAWNKNKKYLNPHKTAFFGSPRDGRGWFLQEIKRSTRLANKKSGSPEKKIKNDDFGDFGTFFW